MDKKKRTLIEFGKDILILALTVSAVYMAADLFVVGGLDSLWKQETQVREGVETPLENTSAATPVRIAITSWSGGTMTRYGVQYDRTACQIEFQTVAGLLREALSGTGPVQTVSEEEWRGALSQTTNLYFDLLGSYPLSVLSGWLGGAESEGGGTARRLMLSAQGDQVKLYYLDEGSGEYRAQTALLLAPEQLDSAADTVVENGAKFAFELEGYESLDGLTMLLPEEPEPKTYRASNPLSGEIQAEEVQPGSVLAEFLRALSFPENSYIYPGTDQVIRSGNDTLRISADGMVRYAAPEGESSRYLVPTQGSEPTRLEIAQACRSLAEGAVGAFAGEGRVFLKEMVHSQEGWTVDFGCSLNGAEVQMGQMGCAARFVVRGQEITQFTLRVRSYDQTGSWDEVLPERQAMAAMAAMDLYGRELILVYRDMGGEEVSAGWVAEQ